MSDAAKQDSPPEIGVRIPGMWEAPEDLVKALPCGYRLGPDGLRMPEGGRVELFPHPPDKQFSRLFLRGCRRPPPKRVQKRIKAYRVNLCLAGPGGSNEAARRMMKAAGALVEAGGFGVFVDNSGVVHRGDDWLELSKQSDEAALFWAFVAAIGNKREIWSIGMHVLGLCDGVLARTGDDEEDQISLCEFLDYTITSGAIVADGDYVGDLQGPRFRVCKEPCRGLPASSPLHNPYGRWRLVPVEKLNHEEHGERS